MLLSTIDHSTVLFFEQQATHTSDYHSINISNFNVQAHLEINLLYPGNTDHTHVAPFYLLQRNATSC